MTATTRRPARARLAVPVLPTWSLYAIPLAGAVLAALALLLGHPGLVWAAVAAVALMVALWFVSQMIVSGHRLE